MAMFLREWMVMGTILDRVNPMEEVPFPQIRTIRIIRIISRRRATPRIIIGQYSPCEIITFGGT